ncbi:hypothetical protein DIS18_03805 [Algibacter marinivivus]|uniref:Uncharacterized protein n=1 Tax=Algibacter marinivivus TaxID=2100723 RepID=A0A2U2X7G4_9FLAO|nr:hypothetical protein [Algibacter marinivivus]PWH83690.1 hypothetical protein DIS18_03805 [Algibacter marinivivus]
MKLLLILLSITLAKGCYPQAEQDNLSLEYTASTRGSYLQIIIKDKTIYYSKERGANSITKSCPDELWEKILKECYRVDLEKLPTFTVPSKNHQLDGALRAYLKIITNGEIHQSQSFDHGNPPKEIASLVKEILSVVENIE